MIGDGVRIIDTNFRIIYENHSHRELFGYNVGQYCYEAYQKRDLVCENCAVARSFHDGKVHQDVRSIASVRVLKYVEVTSSNLVDDNGRIIAGVEVVRDITERIMMEAEKEKLISDLQDAINNINALTGLQFVPGAKKYVMIRAIGKKLSSDVSGLQSQVSGYKNKSSLH